MEDRSKLMTNLLPERLREFVDAELADYHRPEGDA